MYPCDSLSVPWMTPNACSLWVGTKFASGLSNLRRRVFCSLDILEVSCNLACIVHPNGQRSVAAAILIAAASSGIVESALQRDSKLGMVATPFLPDCSDDPARCLWQRPILAIATSKTRKNSLTASSIG